MGSFDRPGEPDGPNPPDRRGKPGGHSSSDRPEGSDSADRPRNRPETEADAAERLGLSTLTRGDYYDSQRAAADAQEAAIRRRDAESRDKGESTEADDTEPTQDKPPVAVDQPERRLEEPRSYWTEVPRFFAMWHRIADRWPGRRAPDGPPPRLEQEAVRIDATAKSVVEAEPPISDNVERVVGECSRHTWLEGFEFRLKGIDRIKEKAAEKLEAEPDRTPEEAVREIPDAIRYTFCLGSKDYSAGYGEIKEKLELHGYDMYHCKNWWDNEEYKGVNTRWVTPEGQQFEVQFHTAESFHAKHQVTHQAYERLRNPATNEHERIELRAFQREVSSWIPNPDGVRGIPDYKKEGF